MGDRLIPDGGGGFHLPDSGRLTPDGMGGFHVIGGGAGDALAAGLAGLLALPMLILAFVAMLLASPVFGAYILIAIMTQVMLGRPLQTVEMNSIFSQGVFVGVVFWFVVITLLVILKSNKKK